MFATCIIPLFTTKYSVRGSYLASTGREVENEMLLSDTE